MPTLFIKSYTQRDKNRAEMTRLKALLIMPIPRHSVHATHILALYLAADYFSLCSIPLGYLVFIDQLIAMTSPGINAFHLAFVFFL